MVPDLSAFSDEDTYTRYTDLQYPPEESGDQLPLGVRVSQRNLAWMGVDFIVHDMVIENVGPYDLTDVYVGFCWDFNIARLAGGYCADDDLVGFDAAEEISYMFDDDGDGSLSPGYIGGSFLNSPQAGHGWWSSSQEPLDDAARYGLLSGGLMDDPEEPDDYRLVQSVGPFDFPMGRKIPLIYALAIGEGPSNLQQTVLDAAEAVVRDTVVMGDSTLYEGETHSIEVILGETKRALGRVQFAVDWEFCDVGLILIDPQGNQVTPETALTNPFVSYMAKPHRKAYEIVNPLLGEWTLLLSYNTGPGLIDYRHTITVFGLPWDFGHPMESFKVNAAFIRFQPSKADPINCNKSLQWASKNEPDKEDLPGFVLEPSRRFPICVGGLFGVAGEMSLTPGASFDPSMDPVILIMGSYEETIPPGSFIPDGPETYLFLKPWPVQGIWFMILDFENGTFHVLARNVNMAGTVNPVLVSLAIGPETGSESIFMQQCGNWWYYYADGEQPAKPAVLGSSLPSDFSLNQNYPNPFNATTQISYSISQEADVLLAIYNVRGQQVAILVDGRVSAGTHRVTWDGRDAFGNQAASGIYFCYLRAGGMSNTRKMILLR
jgi:hypothetical protein